MRSKLSQRTVALFLVLSCLAASSSGQASEAGSQVPAIMLPGMVAAGEAVVEEDGVAVAIPLLWPHSVRLMQQLVLRDGNENITLDAGTLLPRVRVGQGSYDAPGRFVFCTRSRTVAMPNPDRGVLGGLLLGGGVGNLYNSMVDGQTCLEDRDQDGNFESALVLGVGSEGRRELGRIDPLPFSVLQNTPIDVEGDQLRIALRSVRTRNVRLEVNFVQRGYRQTYDVLSSGHYTTPKFVTIAIPSSSEQPSTEIFGVRLTILAVDPRNGTARITWAPIAAPDEVVVVPSEVAIRQR